MKSDLSPIFMLVYMPCGCVIEALELVPVEGSSETIAAICECIWCGATLDGVDFVRWCDANREHGQPRLGIPRPLFRRGTNLFEFAGKFCGCGQPMLRVHRGTEEFHFQPDLQEVPN